MSFLVVLAVALGGACGAVLRALAGRLVRSRLPLATLGVNITGSFVLAAAHAWLPEQAEVARALVGAGFCGALTTFSTFILELAILMRSGQRRVAIGYLAATLLLCCLASWAGFHFMA